jgi:hypothetical protein
MLSENGSENEVLFLEVGGMPCDVDPKLPMLKRSAMTKAIGTGWRSI